MRDLPWHLLLNLGQEQAGVQAKRFIWTNKGTSLSNARIESATGHKGMICLWHKPLQLVATPEVVLPVTDLNETGTSRYFLSKQARFQLGQLSIMV